MATYDDDQQLPLPLASRRTEPQVADAEDIIHQRHSNGHKLFAEFSDAELLTALLGPATALSCEWIMTAHDSFRAVAVLTAAELREHGFATAAVNRLSVVFEIAKRYGEKEFKIGEPLRGSGDIYAHFHERLATEAVEYSYAVLLDNKHRKLRDVVLSKGSLTASIVHPRDVFAQVIEDRCLALLESM